MEKTYQPQDIERRCYESWEAQGFFRPSGSGKPYCIMIPPPNVTGTLHMGHAFQDTIMDALIRYHRMRGDNTLWQAGTDHAGIATQMVVERQLNAEGKSRLDLGREAFVERVWQWKEQSSGTITNQLRRLGSSLDWSRERFTMDEGLSQAVTRVFVELHEDGLIYRGKRLVNWDPVLHTALSDLEVVTEEESGQLWHLRYPLADGSGHVTVATTRPETMLGDTAVAVHPADERYAGLHGKTIALPLTGRSIPVIADEYVDPEFGSGCVKITPAHDFNDYEVGTRHSLERINLFTDDARLNDNAPEPYRGLDRFAARERIVADLNALGLIEKIDDHRHAVPRGDRSGAVLEPYLTDQWFVRAQTLAEPAIKAVEDGRVRFVPENWSRTYFEWMRNIQDWCISRQLWWGHRIPAWYDDSGKVYVGADEAAVRASNHLDDKVALRQDEDVLDTWFSSALWPFSTLDWPEKSPALATWYPTSVLVTGFDIIFFWVARMIMMGLRFMGEVPFHEVYIHGLVRDADGDKMSKSKGNVLDPLDLVDGISLEDLVAKRTTGLMQPQMRTRIEKATKRQYPDGIPAFGTDALRFTFAALATHGRDVRFDLARVEGYRNFCNKLWNASRFVWINTDGQDCGQQTDRTGATDDDLDIGLAERWIQSRFAATANAVHEHFAGYRFDLAARAIYEFAWNEYCDWYLEMSKPLLQDADADPRRVRAVRRTLVRTLEALARLLHPLAPFISEAIWQGVAPLAGVSGPSVMIQPSPDGAWLDEEAEAEMKWPMQFVLCMREIRGELEIPPHTRVAVLLESADEDDLARLDEHWLWLQPLARLESARALKDGENIAASATAMLGNMTMHVPIADPAAEVRRLGKKLEQERKNLEQSRRKLENEKFIGRAPADVVEEVRRRATAGTASVEKIESQIARLSTAL